jgi:hypothetical protein
MVHCVITTWQVNFHGGDRERFGHLFNGRSIPREANEAGIERVRILTDRLLRVALRVDRYKQHLHSRYRCCFFGLRQFDERGGAHVRAMRESKEHETRLAQQILLRERMSLAVGELKVGHGAGDAQPGSACKGWG